MSSFNFNQRNSEGFNPGATPPGLHGARFGSSEGGAGGDPTSNGLTASSRGRGGFGFGTGGSVSISGLGAFQPIPVSDATGSGSGRGGPPPTPMDLVGASSASGSMADSLLLAMVEKAVEKAIETNLAKIDRYGRTYLV